ncbi:RagB/SusD family nutrient uptake outer membrane protein [Flavivirga eckloniae]|uniref:RagB/SusD family nutrient uptake outer membrane protein n=1 Tax=Flavivirga eckloniae TaxID=1803846 RepID=A0A2K9PLJ2_9FLAO|nr:RagB/SusD family nutrient uptake outer membrane protein [Flavivirga eckloniae]AUP77933.1 hypothetical protein C1H87_04080 [Flavivirga eckloniae]
MKKIIYIIIAFAFIVSGCTRDSFLDIKPKGTVIPSTLQDYRALLDQVLGPPMQPSLSLGFGRSHSLPSFVTDNQNINEDIVTSFGLNRRQIRAYTFQESFYSPQEEDLDWLLYYNQIYGANLILEGLDEVTDGTSSQINELKAEARLHRAFAYFNLVNIYSVHYDPASASTDLGMPIREGIELEGLDLTRVSVQETYDYILNDITMGLNDLKDSQPQNVIFRPSKAAAQGLLAKIYLYMGNYNLALNAANEALSYNDVLRDINDDERSQENPNVILQPLAINNVEVIWAKSYLFLDPIFATEELVDSYEVDDARSLWYDTLENFFGQSIDGSAYISQLNSEDYATVGITTADMYLIVAECNARLGNTEAANTSLNLLRENRFFTDTYTPLMITDPTELLTFVKAERRREMVSSMQRMFDIKRYNRFDNDNISLSHTVGSLSGSIEPNSLNWAFPISEKYIQLNPEIIQNPRD